MTQAIETFFAAWGDPDAGTRAEALRGALSDPFYYADPRTPEPITGADALIAYVAMYTQYAPGATARVAALSETKGHYRATIAFEMADGTTQYGQYMIDLNDDGKAARLIGFAGLGEPE